jgi:hypothetical protein
VPRNFSQGRVDERSFSSGRQAACPCERSEAIRKNILRQFDLLDGLFPDNAFGWLYAWIRKK